MNETSVRFVGSVPENYDRDLGPYLFEDYAAGRTANAKNGNAHPTG